MSQAVSAPLMDVFVLILHFRLSAADCKCMHPFGLMMLWALHQHFQSLFKRSLTFLLTLITCTDSLRKLWIGKKPGKHMGIHMAKCKCAVFALLKTCNDVKKDFTLTKTPAHWAVVRSWKSLSFSIIRYFCKDSAPGFLVSHGSPDCCFHCRKSPSFVSDSHCLWLDPAWSLTLIQSDL